MLTLHFRKTSTEDYLVGDSGLNAWRNLKNYGFIYALGDIMFTRMDGPHAVRNEGACLPTRNRKHTRPVCNEGYEMREYCWKRLAQRALYF